MDSYSLWLLPEDEASVHLGQLIADLAGEYGGPTFLPHVTLLGHITGPDGVLIRRTEHLAERVPAMTLSFGGIGYRSQYYQALFVRITPSTPLRAAHTAARTLFPGVGVEPFQPHLSLLYGEYPEALKRRLAAKLVREGSGTLRFGRLALYYTGGRVSDWHRAFTADLA